MDGRSAFESVTVDSPLEGPGVVTDVVGMTMAARGLLPGDRIIVERCRATDLEPGHVVMFRHEGAVRIGEWQPPMILFHPLGLASSDSTPLRTSNVEVYGRVRRVVREL